MNLFKNWRKLLRTIQYGLSFISVSLLCSCSTLVNSFVIEPAVSNLERQSDFHLVCEGGPAYLLMIDSLIESDPEDPALLTLGAKAYSGYLSALTECDTKRERLNTIAEKAKKYGVKRLSQQLPISPKESLDTLQKALASTTDDDVGPLFWSTAAWTSWVFQQQGSPDSIADLVKIEKILLRLLELDESYADGAIHLILGSYYGAKPKMIGGKPELAAHHFEQGLRISKRSYLPLQIAYAQTYCRMTMNRKLHDLLLKEVIDFPLESALDHALANQVAKTKAVKMIEEDFFGE